MPDAGTPRLPQQPSGDARVPASPGRVRAAWIVALAADAIQLGLFPFFAAGAGSPFNDALDVGVAIVMIALLRWHWAFLPTFIAELVPFVDLVPSWSLACWIATRGRGAKPGAVPPPA